VFYRLTPAEALMLPGPEYLGLCYRVSAYQGVMQALHAEREETQEQAQGEVAPDRAAIETTPAVAGLSDWG